MAVKTLAAEIKDVVKYPPTTPPANSLDVAETAPDVALDGIEYVATGREVVIAHNTHGTTPYSVTLKSTANSQNRTGDIGPYTLQAGEYAAFIPPLAGFAGTGNKVTVVMENIAVKVMVIRLPNLI